jgi:hypothetical protein
MGTKSSEGEAVMKRFVVFAFDWYYPSGGMNDLRGSADSIEEAKALIRQSSTAIPGRLSQAGRGIPDGASVLDSLRRRGPRWAG